MRRSKKGLKKSAMYSRVHRFTMSVLIYLTYDFLYAWHHYAVGESGVSYPLNSTKKAEEKMIMYSIVWSHSKDLLHLAALKIHLVVGKFEGKFYFSHF